MLTCNIYWRALLLAFSLTAFSAPGHTETTEPVPVDQGANRTVTFVTIDAVPWAATDPETGEPFGAFVEIVEILEQKTGLSIQTDALCPHRPGNGNGQPRLSPSPETRASSPTAKRWLPMTSGWSH